MKIRITSWRGDHQCEVETEIGKAVFEKLTGLNTDALPESARPAVPDTFQELEALWKPGNPGFTAISLDKGGNVMALKTFEPEADEVIFFAPITGG